MKIRIYWKDGNSTDLNINRFGVLDRELLDFRNVLRIDQLSEEGMPLIDSMVCCSNPNPQTFGPNDALAGTTTVCMNCGRLQELGRREHEAYEMLLAGKIECRGGHVYMKNTVPLGPRIAEAARKLGIPYLEALDMSFEHKCRKYDCVLCGNEPNESAVLHACPQRIPRDSPRIS